MTDTGLALIIRQCEGRKSWQDKSMIQKDFYMLLFWKTTPWPSEESKLIMTIFELIQ